MPSNFYITVRHIRVIYEGTKYEATVETDDTYDDDSFYIKGPIIRDGVEVNTHDTTWWRECKKIIVDEYFKLRLASVLGRIKDDQKSS